MAQLLSEQTAGFFETKGPGKGDQATQAYMDQLRIIAKQTFGEDLSEKQLVTGVGYRVDFYFPEEATVVEFAFTLHQPINEFERDIFKCLLGREDGHKISRLLFVCKPGGEAKQMAPGPKAISNFVQRKLDLEIAFWELVPAGV